MTTPIVKTESACAEEDFLWAWTVRVRNRVEVRQAKIADCCKNLAVKNSRILSGEKQRPKKDHIL